MTKQKQFTHTANDRTPYTYLIGWKKLDKWYYGVRYAKNCHPTDLWVTYFTSSFLLDEFKELYGEPDVIQIRKVFDNAISARKWEATVLHRLKVSSTTKFLNKCGSKFRVVLTKDIPDVIDTNKPKYSRSTQKLTGDFAYIRSFLVSDQYCLLRECPTCKYFFDCRPRESKKYCSVICCNSAINHSSIRKTYLCTAPDETEYLTDNLRDFCAVHDLKYGSMGHVSTGAYNQHKGWRCRLAPDLITVPRYCPVIDKPRILRVVPAKPDFIEPSIPLKVNSVNFFSKSLSTLKGLINRLTRPSFALAD